MADGKQLLILGALGVGGYLVYKNYFATTTTTTAASGTQQQPSSMLPTVIANMQQKLGGVTTASTDAWNWAFAQVMGQGLDQKYNFNFASVYGPAVGSANISAAQFFDVAARAVPGGLPGLLGLGALGGLGAFARFLGPHVQTTGNMLYQAHHPLPYASTYTLKGMGAFTQPSGFERALFAGRPLSGNRAFGRRVMR